MTDNHEFMSTETGELYTGFMVRKQVKYPRSMMFSTSFDDGLDLLLGLDITLTDYRVLLTMVRVMDFGNWVRISQAGMARKLSMAASNFSAAVARLIAQGLIQKTKDPRDASRDVYRVSLFLWWRGRPEDWVKAVNNGEGLCFAGGYKAVATKKTMSRASEVQDSLESA